MYGEGKDLCIFHVRAEIVPVFLTLWASKAIILIIFHKCIKKYKRNNFEIIEIKI